MIALSPAELDRLFPFHIRFDAEGSILGLGSSLDRAIGGVAESLQWEQFVHVRRPARFSPELLSSGEQYARVLVLRIVGSELSLRGQVVSFESVEGFWFLGSPWCTGIEEVSGLGLRADDFAMHDPTLDMIALMSTQQKALTEARELGRALEERQQHLETARLEAEEANRAKSRFLAVMSHEIRTPMNGLGSMVDLLRCTSLNAEQAEYADTIRSCSETLVALLNDMLDVAKVEAGKVELEEREFSPAQLAREVVALYRSAASASGMQLTLWLCPELPPLVAGDPLRLRQILSNVVGNAVKFAGGGEVLVVVGPPEDRSTGNVLRVRVQDTGPGVPAEKREQVFQVFTQADNSISRRHGGTGLGLTISRQLARLMGGDLWIEDSPGGGASFVLDVEMRLPVGNAWREPLRLETRGGLPEGTRASLARLGVEWVESGGACVVAPSGEDSTAPLDDDDPRPVLFHGPGGPADPGGEISDSTPSTVGTTTEAAAWARALNAALFAVSPAPVDVRPSYPTFPGTRVLVAEDVPTNRLIIKRLLQKLGIEPVFAMDGQEALDKLLVQRFELVLMDVEMPRLDGCSAVRQWRAMEVASERLPILALTARAMAEHRQEALDAGMDEVVIKPIRLGMLAEALRQWLPAERLHESDEAA